MNRRLMLMAGALLLLLATGCPLVSNVPVARPDAAALDGRLMGLWAGVDDDGDSLGVEILPFNESECFAEVWNEEGASRLRIFAFEVGGTRFLHVNELVAEGEDLVYLVASYEFAGDGELVIRFVGDAIVPADVTGSPAAFAKFLKGHLNDPTLYDETALTLSREE